MAIEDCDCILRCRDSYPWHDVGYRPPPFHELVVYQLHVGVFSARDVIRCRGGPHVGADRQETTWQH